jgi:hypothetical protein
MREGRRGEEITINTEFLRHSRDPSVSAAG